MGAVIEMKKYRKRNRELFLRQHGEKLDRSIKTFMLGNMDLDFMGIAEQYLNEKASNNELAWDYLDLRDELREAIAQTFGPEILKELRSKGWFDAKLVTEDEIIDRCLSAFILNDQAKIS